MSGVAETAPRHPERCSYRYDPRPEIGPAVQSARCALLEALCPVRDRDLAAEMRVDWGACALCCADGREPSPGAPNAAVASQVIHFAQRIAQRGGVEGCDAERARLLVEWATGFLLKLGKSATELRTPPYSRECLFLGEPVGGRGRARRFGCAHELHHETTIEGCHRCPDYDPVSATGGGAVGAWAVGVVTAPRRRPTLAATLKSLAAAGWPDPFVFADSALRLPCGLVPAERAVRRPVRYYGWGNYVSALHELTLIHPDADAYLMVEDDVLFCRGLRAYLERELWPVERLGFVSLHTASHQDRPGQTGFYVNDLRGGIQWGAQAIVFPNASARLFLRHPRVINHRSRGPLGGRFQIDVVAGAWAQSVGLPIYTHTPSPTQHIGATSAMWSGQPSLAGNRVASSFPGEDKDIRRVVAGRRAARSRRGRR